MKFQWLGKRFILSYTIKKPILVIWIKYQLAQIALR
jgi:hypothetical protein